MLAKALITSAIPLCIFMSQPRSEMLFNLNRTEAENESRNIGTQLYDIISRVFQALLLREKREIDSANDAINNLGKEVGGLPSQYRKLSPEENLISLESFGEGKRNYIESSFKKFGLNVPSSTGGLVSVSADAMENYASLLTEVRFNGGPSDIAVVRNIYDQTFSLLNIGSSVSELSSSAGRS